MLADDVLQRPRIAGGRAFVVEEAHETGALTSASSRIAGVRDDAIAVLKERRQRLQIRVARFLHRGAVAGTAAKRSAARHWRSRRWGRKSSCGAPGVRSRQATRRSTKRPSLQHVRQHVSHHQPDRSGAYPSPYARRAELVRAARTGHVEASVCGQPSRSRVRGRCRGSGRDPRDDVVLHDVRSRCGEITPFPTVWS